MQPVAAGPACRPGPNTSYRIGNEPRASRNFPAHPVIIPSNTRRQPRAWKGRPEGDRTLQRKDDETGRESQGSRQGLLSSSSLNFCGCFLQLHLPLSNHSSRTSRTTSYRFVLHAWNMRTGLVYESRDRGAAEAGTAAAAAATAAATRPKGETSRRGRPKRKGGAEKRNRRPRKGIYS